MRIVTDTARQAADLLLAARKDPSKKLTDLPAELQPKDRPEAYVIQHMIAATFSGIGGWKVGALGPETNAIMQCGALPAEGVVPSPATTSANTLRGIEAEVAFRMGRDLPPRTR